MLSIGRKHVSALREALDGMDMAALERIANRIIARREGSIWVLGNGGSQANAAHLVLHLNNLGYHAVDLMADTATLTALSNDYGYPRAPSRRLMLSSMDTDALVVISGSGNSENIINALKAASQELRMTTLGLLGFGGGKAKALCDVALILESHDYGVVEDCHSACVHILERMLLAVKKGQ